jgi:hypothetical protein
MHFKIHLVPKKGTIQAGKSRKGMNNGVQHILSRESTKVLTKVFFKERLVASQERMMYSNKVLNIKMAFLEGITKMNFQICVKIC